MFVVSLVNGCYDLTSDLEWWFIGQSEPSIFSGPGIIIEKKTLKKKDICLWGPIWGLDLENDIFRTTKNPRSVDQTI